MDIALLRDVSPAIARCELTYVARQPIDLEQAAAQHRQYADLLRSLGLEVVSLPADPAYPDSCFVEDAAVVLDEVAVITRPGAESRRGETRAVAEALAAHRPLATIQPPATLEGGDVLVVGRKVFVGMSERTSEAGVAALRAIVSPKGYEVAPVRVTGCLHLKSAITALDERTLLANPEWVDLEAFRGYEIVPVPTEEPFAANVVSVRGWIVLHSGFTLTRALLEKRGSAVKPVCVSEFLKAEAGVTCKSLLFRRMVASPRGRG